MYWAFRAFEHTCQQAYLLVGIYFPFTDKRLARWFSRVGNWWLCVVARKTNWRPVLFGSSFAWRSDVKSCRKSLEENKNVSQNRKKERRKRSAVGLLILLCDAQPRQTLLFNSRKPKCESAKMLSLGGRWNQFGTDFGSELMGVYLS